MRIDPARPAGGRQGHAGEATRREIRHRAALDRRHAARGGRGRHADRAQGQGHHGPRRTGAGRGRGIWFTLGALLVYRFGTYIPLPGIDPAAWEQIFNTQAGGILGMFNMFSGGGIHRMAIFALNIMPYISASIIIQLMTTVSPTLEQLKKEGEQGRKVINQYTRYLTVVLAAFQAYGIADRPRRRRRRRSSDPGYFFRISTVDHADRRHHVPDVARRADHRARHRQRHLADHHGRHRRGIAVGDRRHARTRPPGRAVDRPDPRSSS